MAVGARAFASGFRIQRDLPYVLPANPLQSLDVYAPPGAGPRPVVIWVHGGGWARGDKAEDMEVKPRAFVAKGYVLVSVNYRLLPAVTLAEMAGDVAKSVRWLREHAHEYGGDPNSIFLVGHSAGAQLVALVCTDESYLKAEGLSLDAIKGCVPIDGGTYYPPLEIDTAEPRTADSFRLKFPDGKSQRALSSVLHVAPGKGIPPFLILYVADEPRSGTRLQSEILAEALRESDIPVKVIGAVGKKHVTINTDLGLPGDPPTRAIFEFLAQSGGSGSLGDRERH
jgi:acetyl esterase/lipase